MVNAIRRWLRWLLRRQPSATVAAVDTIEPVVSEPLIPSLPILMRKHGMTPYLPSERTVKRRMRTIKAGL